MRTRWPRRERIVPSDADKKMAGKHRAPIKDTGADGAIFIAEMTKKRIVVYRNDGGLWLKFGDAAVMLDQLLEGIPPMTAAIIRGYCEEIVVGPAA